MGCVSSGEGLCLVDPYIFRMRKSSDGEGKTIQKRGNFNFLKSSKFILLYTYYKNKPIPWETYGVEDVALYRSA